MAVAHQFEYFKPATLDEALKMRKEHGDKYRVLAGGTDITVHIKEGFAFPDALIDIKGLAGLDTIEFKDNALHVGALVTFAQIMESEIAREKCPLLVEAAETVASVGVRNRATVAGNICSAVPSLDSGPPLLVHDAVIVAQSSDGSREISIADWFTGPKKTSLKPEEIVTGIRIPVPTEKHAGCYVKLGRYAGEDLAQACVAVLYTANNEYKIALGALGPVPVRAKKTEALLNGKELSEELLEKVKQSVAGEISPITDIRASKEYRILMAGVMTERGLKAAAARLSGETVDAHTLLGG